MKKPRPSLFKRSPLDPHIPVPSPELRAKEIDDEMLARMDHVDWLESFARITLLPSRVPMTPRRLGVGTRLEWAARYIKLLQATITRQEEELVALQKRLKDADDLLATSVTRIRQLKDERDALTLRVTELERQLSEAI
jgi:septal ring factor EnvC (AmiA/AmiB activator)